MFLKKIWHNYSYLLLIGWILFSIVTKPGWLILIIGCLSWLALVYFTSPGVFWSFLAAISFKPENTRLRLQKALSYQPVIAYPYMMLGVIHARKEEWTEATPLLEQAVNLTSAKKVNYTKLLAQAYRENGFYDQALKIFLGIIASGQKTCLLYTDLALTYYKMNQLPESLEAADKARLLDPKAVQPVLIMAKIHFAQKNFPAARDDYEWALSHLSWPVESYYWLGRIEVELGNYPRAVELLKTAVERITADPLLSDITSEEAQQLLVDTEKSLH